MKATIYGNCPFTIPAQTQFRNNYEQSRSREQEIPVVDLSSDETDDRSCVAAIAYPPARLPALNRIVKPEFRKPTPFVDISDDDSDHYTFSNPPFSSTLRKSKALDESTKIPNETDKSGSSGLASPEVVAVNSLKEKQLLKPCMQGDTINAITKRFFELRKVSDQKIQDAKKT